MLSRDAANESPDAGFKFGPDPIGPILSAEDYMIVRDEYVLAIWESSVWDDSQSSLRDDDDFFNLCAGLERPA
jgi:hypothetical protein